MSFTVFKTKLILPLTPKTVTQFFHFHFQSHRAKILDYSWLFCFLNRYGSGRQFWSSSPKFTLHYPLRLIIFNFWLLLYSNPAVVPIACSKSSLETLPVLSTSPQEDLPIPFLFPSPHFIHPFPPFRIRSSMFSVISHWGSASSPIVYGGLSFGTQVYSIPSVKLRFKITPIFWSGLGFTLLKS